MLIVRCNDYDSLENPVWGDISKSINFIYYKEKFQPNVRLFGYEQYAYIEDSSSVILIGQDGENCRKVTVNLTNHTVINEIVGLLELDIDEDLWKTGNPNTISCIVNEVN